MVDKFYQLQQQISVKSKKGTNITRTESERKSRDVELKSTKKCSSRKSRQRTPKYHFSNWKRPRNI